jgi:16S rRNA (uracil1498-N3)-methyltransferase
MTRRRWIADEVSGNNAALVGAHAEHLVRVLRARVGQEFDIVAEGVVRRGRVSSIVDGKVEFELGPEISSTPTAVNLTLLLAVFKFDRMEWAIEKVTELGVARIIPVIARRTDAHLASAAVKRVKRWRRIVVQAAEQSRRTAPPEVLDPIKLQETVKLPGVLKIVLSEAEQDSALNDLIRTNESTSELLLAIGPEGGWTEDELDLFRKEGWASASLGSTILRAETAAIASIAITTSLLS